MQKDGDGGAELLWESPIYNMVEEAVGTSVCCKEKDRIIWLSRNSRKWQIYNKGAMKFGARIFLVMFGPNPKESDSEVTPSTLQIH